MHILHFEHIAPKIINDFITITGQDEQSNS